MSALDYKVEIQPLPESEGGGFIAIVPQLPGCMSDGETEQEALANVKDAIEEWKARARAIGRVIPEPIYDEDRLHA
jgi:antitoxin HicB